MKVHRFESTAECYDECQCRDDVDSGDVLWVPNEGVVGFLLHAWPVAVTAERGELHDITREPLREREFLPSLWMAVMLAEAEGLALVRDAEAGLPVRTLHCCDGASPGSDVALVATWDECPAMPGATLRYTKLMDAALMCAYIFRTPEGEWRCPHALRQLGPAERDAYLAERAALNAGSGI